MNKTWLVVAATLACLLLVRGRGNVEGMTPKEQQYCACLGQPGYTPSDCNGADMSRPRGGCSDTGGGGGGSGGSGGGSGGGGLRNCKGLKKKAKKKCKQQNKKIKKAGGKSGSVSASSSSSGGGGGGGGGGKHKMTWHTYDTEGTGDGHRIGVTSCADALRGRNLDGEYWVAINPSDFGQPTDWNVGPNPCGKKLRITYGGKSIEAFIVDQKGERGIDISPNGRKALVGENYADNPMVDAYIL